MEVLMLLISTIILTIVMILDFFGLVDIDVPILHISIYWISSILALSISLIIRNFYRNKYKKELMDSEDSPVLKENELFYQSPIYIVDDIHIKIHGMDDASWQPYFNNLIQKWLSLLNFMSAFGIGVISPQHKVIVKRVKLWSLRPHYHVYVDGYKVGDFKMRRIINGGIKQQTPYIFLDYKNYYYFNNPYFSTKTTIQEGNNDILLAHRSLFDLGKNLITQRRGEKHYITVLDNYDYPQELWLALYIQVMLNKQKE
ncbi:hypothetical protein BUY46_08755 [Staphylococcus devriesei]|nr:hypothetical protein BUY46_08755 [Staphylococcus devriesei]